MGVLWSRSCRAIQQRVEELVKYLAQFGLSLNPGKCQLYTTKNVEDGSRITVGGVVITSSEYMEIMGIKMYVGISIYELVSPPSGKSTIKVLGAEARVQV